jgi:hypothetical protein
VSPDIVLWLMLGSAQPYEWSEKMAAVEIKQVGLSRFCEKKLPLSFPSSSLFCLHIVIIFTPLALLMVKWSFSIKDERHMIINSVTRCFTRKFR